MLALSEGGVLDTVTLPGQTVYPEGRTQDDLNIYYFAYYFAPFKGFYSYTNDPPLPRCDLYAAKTSIYWVFSWDFGKFNIHHVPVKAADISPYDVDATVNGIKLDYTCCMLGGECPDFIDNVNVYKVYFTIRPFSQNGLDSREQARFPCYTCIMRDVGPRVCPDGTYADNFLNINSKGFVTTTSHCIPCKPGTWMACAEKSSCQWNIPTNSTPYLASSKDYYVFADHIPVGSCYPCILAGARPYYADDPKRKNTVYAYYAGKDPIPWYLHCRFMYSYPQSNNVEPGTAQGTRMGWTACHASATRPTWGATLLTRIARAPRENTTILCLAASTVLLGPIVSMASSETVQTIIIRHKRGRPRASRVITRPPIVAPGPTCANAWGSTSPCPLFV